VGLDPPALQLDDLAPHPGMRRYRRHVRGHLRPSDLGGDVLVAEQGALVLDHDPVGIDRGEDGILVVRRRTRAKRLEGDRPVGGPGVEMGQAERLGQAARDGALAHPAGSVYRDDHTASRSS